MRLIFCSDPMEPRKPDSAYVVEADAAESLGIEYDLISYEALVYDNDPLKAVRRVQARPDLETALYRGWMLAPDAYTKLYDALLDRSMRLINDPAAYKHCHHLPESYSVIKGLTPASVWLKTSSDFSIEEIMELLRPFGSAPVILKDFVKSRKHEWDEACYIPSASDIASVERVVRRFIELQGEDLNEGFVFREFVEFEPLAKHSKSGMPLTKEFRIFYLNAKPIYSVEYWEEGDYEGIDAPVERFGTIAKRVQSRFFTMDIAKRLNGDWMIVELGDAQVSGLPEHADAVGFYRSIRNGWPPAQPIA